jgi:hypothetical protein
MKVLAIDPAVRGMVRLALSLLFVWAASHKLRDISGFRTALTAYELLPSRGVGAFAELLIAMEIGVAAGMWLPGRAATAAFAASGLLAMYAGAIAVNLVRGHRDIDCGCAGAAADRPLSGALVLRNGFLLVAALMLTLPATSRPLMWLDAVTICAGVAGLALLYAAADGLLANAPKIAALAGDRPLRSRIEVRPARVDTAASERNPEPSIRKREDRHA